ncbi:MAG TPA: MFS transporter [Sphingomonas sp.]
MNFHGRTRVVVLAALSLLYFLLMASTFNSLGQVLPSMVTDLNMDWAQAGFGFTLLGIACGVASLLPAMTIRRMGVSLTLGIGALLLFAGFIALAATRSVIVYHVGATLLGLGFCFCGTVPSVHVISSMFERRSTALGIYFTSGSLGAVFGPVFFYVVSELAHGWRSYWVICGVASLVVGALAMLVTRGGGPVRKDEFLEGDVPDLTQWSLRHALATPQFWLIVGAYTGCLLVNTTVHSFAFQHLMEHGQTKASATALISVAALVGAIAAAAAGLIGEKVDGRRLTMLSLGALAITSASLAIGAGSIALGAFAVSMGVGLGFSYVSTAMLMQDYFGRRASLELYSVMTWISTSAAIGPGIGGIVRDRTGSFSSVFMAIALIDVALLIGVLAMRKPVPFEAEAPLA